MKKKKERKNSKIYLSKSVDQNASVSKKTVEKEKGVHKQLRYDQTRKHRKLYRNSYFIITAHFFSSLYILRINNFVFAF